MTLLVFCFEISMYKSMHWSRFQWGQKWALNREITWKHTCFSVNVYMKEQEHACFHVSLQLMLTFDPTGKGPLTYIDACISKVQKQAGV